MSRDLRAAVLDRCFRGAALCGQPGHPPHSPEGRRIGEGISVDKEEIGGAAFDDSAGRWFSEKVSAADRRGSQRLPGFEASLYERLDLPREMVRSQGSAAEIRARRRADVSPVREV